MVAHRKTALMATEHALTSFVSPAVCEQEKGEAPRGGYGAAYREELDEAQLIRRHVAMVKRAAAHLKGRLPETVQLDDLVQAGLIAILRLARRGNASQVSDSLLRRSVVNAMIDEARREVWAPVRTLRLAQSATQAMRATKLRLGRDGSDEEIAAEMGVPLREYHAVLVETAGIRLLNLDEFDDADDRLSISDDQDMAIDRGRMLTALAQSIAALPAREKLVMSLYYEQELNMDEVGKVLGLDKSTVSRAHGRALLMLRTALSEWRGVGEASPMLAAGG